eukprot:1354094-Alexandrium_andersonii.AAC.1
MSASLVGSEMCIRDSGSPLGHGAGARPDPSGHLHRALLGPAPRGASLPPHGAPCGAHLLLSTFRG